MNSKNMFHIHITDLHENHWQKSLFSVKMLAISHFLQYIKTSFPETLADFIKTLFQEQWPHHLLYLCKDAARIN